MYEVYMAEDQLVQEFRSGRYMVITDLQNEDLYLWKVPKRWYAMLSHPESHDEE